MRTVKFGGEIMELEGTWPEIGQKAPYFQLVDYKMQPVTPKNYAGKPVVIASVPSLDTPVCDLEVRHFNEESKKLADKVTFLAVSRDLPFAQTRWIENADVSHVIALSDYKLTDFGLNYGVLIKELRLLARAVFVINADGVLTYSQLCPEVRQPPEYGPILEAINKLL